MMPGEGEGGKGFIFRLAMRSLEHSPVQWSTDLFLSLSNSHLAPQSTSAASRGTAPRRDQGKEGGDEFEGGMNE